MREKIRRSEIPRSISTSGESGESSESVNVKRFVVLKIFLSTHLFFICQTFYPQKRMLPLSIRGIGCCT